MERNTKIGIADSWPSDQSASNLDAVLDLWDHAVPHQLFRRDYEQSPTVLTGLSGVTLGMREHVPYKVALIDGDNSPTLLPCLMDRFRIVAVAGQSRLLER